MPNENTPPLIHPVLLAGGSGTRRWLRLALGQPPPTTSQRGNNKGQEEKARKTAC